MAAIPPSVLVASIIDGIQQSGGDAAYLSPGYTVHPRVFGVQYLSSNFTIAIYIWTLTHGGRPSLPDEYRIQLTSVVSPLDLTCADHVVLMGYHEDTGIFAGFDIVKHQHFTTGSSSVQIDLSVLHRALQDGLAFGTKSNEEIAVGVRKDQFINYVLNADELHKEGADALTFELLNYAAHEHEIDKSKFDELNSERKKIVSEVTRYSRNANFRMQVLDAYQHRCAVTRMQLKIVEAAHILPVSVPGSVDKVTNGLALSPTIHKAFDNGLIFLDRDCNLQINNDEAGKLITLGLDSGLNYLKGFTEKPIHLPANRAQWPDKNLITEANKHRLIPGY